MKKNLFYAMSLMALFSLGSCSQEDLADVKQEDGVKLGVESVASTINQSRALVETAYLPDESEIGLFFMENGKTTYNNQTYNNIKYTASGTTDQEWGSTAAPTLTDVEGNAYVYYPYKSDNTDITAIPVNVNVGIGDDFDDFMYSSTPATASWTNKNVNFTMKHLCSIIRITFKRGTYQGDCNLTNIKIESANTATTGTFNLMTNTFTPTNEGDISKSMDDTFKDANLTIDIPVIPTPTESSMINWSLFFGMDGSDNTGYGGIMWDTPYKLESGKIYKFEVTINRVTRNATISSVGVETWGAGNGENGYQYTEEI